MNEVLERISKLRQKRHLSQEKISEDLHISQAAYTKLERGETKLTVDRLFEIAKSLKTDVGELLGLDNQYKQDIHNNNNPTIIAHQEIENQYIEDKGIINELLKKYEEALDSKNKLIEILEKRIIELGEK